MECQKPKLQKSPCLGADWSLLRLCHNSLVGKAKAAALAVMRATGSSSTDDLPLGHKIEKKLLQCFTILFCFVGSFWVILPNHKRLLGHFVVSF